MSSFFTTAINGLTYNGNVKQMAVNYALVLLVMLPHFFASDNLKENTRSWYWVVLSAIILQVLVWYVAGAAGVSIIWCAIAGCNMLRFGPDFLYLPALAKTVLLGSLLFAISAVVYYFISLPVITTLAHVIAWSMGIVLFYIYHNLYAAKLYN